MQAEAVALGDMASARNSSLRQAGGFTISELVLILGILAGLIGVIAWSLSGIDGQLATRDCRSELVVLKAGVQQY